MTTPTKKKTVTKSTSKPITKANPELILFEELISTIKSDVKKTVDYRISVKDDSPDSIYHYTNEVIKGLIRASKWA